MVEQCQIFAGSILTEVRSVPCNAYTNIYFPHQYSLSHCCQSIFQTASDNFRILYRSISNIIHFLIKNIFDIMGSAKVQWHYQSRKNRLEGRTYISELYQKPSNNLSATSGEPYKILPRTKNHQIIYRPLLENLLNFCRGPEIYKYLKKEATNFSCISVIWS